MTLWHKPAYTALDRDPATGDLLPGALPPGLYCEDEEAFAKLRAAARLRQSSVRATLDGGWDLAGQRVFVCTPAQASMFRAVAMKDPPAPPKQPSAQVGKGTIITRTMTRSMGDVDKVVLRTSPPTRHPFHGANRA